MHWLIMPALAAVLVFACFMAYSDSFNGVFILDDIPYIDAPRIQSINPALSPWDDARFDPNCEGKMLGRYVVEYSLALNYWAGGMDTWANHNYAPEWKARAMFEGGHNVWGYHLVNIIIHALAAIVLMGVVRRALMRPCVSERFRRYSWLAGFLTAMLWMLHPIQTQAVTYVVQRTESMMSLFFLLVMYCMLRAVDSTNARDDAPARKPPANPLARALKVIGKNGWHIAAVASCAVGMLCKQNMVVAPVAAILFDRIFLATSWKEMFRRRWGLHAALVGTLALVVVGLMQPPPGIPDGMPPAIPVEMTSRPVYFASQMGVILHYLWLCIWPQAQCLDYAWVPAIPAETTLGSILHAPMEFLKSFAANVLPGAVVVLGLLAATIWALIRRPAVGFVGAWFFITLAVTSSFIVPIVDICFVHRMYLALASVCLAGVLGGVWLADTWSVALPSNLKLLPGTILTIMVLALAIVLGMGTYARNSDYDTTTKVWEDVVRKRPDNARGLTNLSHYLLEKQQFAKAEALTRHSIEVNPAYVLAYINHGNAMMGLKKYDGAMADFTKAIELRPKYKEAFYNRGNLWEMQGQREKAIDDFTQSVACDPTYGPAYHNRAVSYYLMGQTLDLNTPGSGTLYYQKAWDDVKKAEMYRTTPKPDFMKLLMATTQPGSVRP